MTERPDAGMKVGTMDIVLTHQVERSVLHDPRRVDLQPYVVGGRSRLATCSGVAWFRGHHLAVVNLYGGHLRIYRFHPGGGLQGDAPRLELLHEMTQGLCCPESVAVSRDGSLLAVTHSLSDDLGLSLHRIDAASLAPDPGTNLRRGRQGSAFHGVSFSPDSRHLAFSEIGTPSYVEVVRVGAGPVERTCLFENRHDPMKPKGVSFSSDGQFLAIAMSLNAGPKAGATTAPPTLVSIHPFDAIGGVIDPEPVAQDEAGDSPLACPDLSTFLPSTSGTRHTLLISDQALDAVVSFDFDAERRTLAYTGIFAADLSFPHGIDASVDGRFVAISNYGDDTVRIVRVTA